MPLELSEMATAPTNEESNGQGTARRNDLKICGVCGDKALGYNFNAITCESCKAFFRRNALKTKEYRCPFNGNCKIDIVTRRFCQKCRLKKCFQIGMKKEWIMTEEEKLMKRKKIEENRAKKLPDGCKEQIFSSNDIKASSEEKLPGFTSGKPQARVTAMQHLRIGTNANKFMRADPNFNETFSDESAAKDEPAFIDSPSSPYSTSTLDVIGSTSPFSSSLISSSQISETCNSSYLLNSGCDTNSTIIKKLPHLSADISKHHSIRISEDESESSMDDRIEETSPFHTSNFSNDKSLKCVPGSPVMSLSDSVEHIEHIISSNCDSNDKVEPFQKWSDPESPIEIKPILIFPTAGSDSSIEKHSPKVSYQSEISLSPTLVPTTSSSQSIKLSNSELLLSTNDVMLNVAHLDNYSEDSVGYNDTLQTLCDHHGNICSKNDGCNGFQLSCAGVENCRQSSSYDILNTVLNVAICAEFSSFSNPIFGSRSNQELNVAEKGRLDELIIANEAMKYPLIDDGVVTDTSDPSLINVINLTDIAIRRLIKMGKKINSFKSLCQEDQVALLKGGCTELLILRSVMSFDPDRHSWKIPQSDTTSHHIKVDVLKEARGNVYEEHQRFIKSFEPRWRADENIMLLLSAITLFTPDRPNVVHKDVVKFEQDSYFYLLRRYLEGTMSGCDARSCYLKLVHKIAELHILNENHVRVFLDLNPKEVEPLLIEIFDLKPKV